MALLPLVAAGVGVVGTGLRVAGQLRAGQAAAQAHRSQGVRDERTAEQRAALLERDAVAAEQEAREEAQAIALDAQTMRRQFRRLQGQQVAQTFAAGIELEGSPLDILAETAGEAQLAIEQAEFGSAQRQQALRDEAAQARFGAAELRRAGTDALAVSRVRGRIVRTTGRNRAIAAGLGGVSQALMSLQPAAGGGT